MKKVERVEGGKRKRERGKSDLGEGKAKNNGEWKRYGAPRAERAKRRWRKNPGNAKKAQ